MTVINLSHENYHSWPYPDGGLRQVEPRILIIEMHDDDHHFIGSKNQPSGIKK